MNPADSFALSLPGDRAHITITRWFAAPPDVLWRRYTDPRHLVQFYGAPGCTHPICEMIMRPGGTWRHTLPDARCPMADGRWPMADGRWPMADGRWPMADGREFPSLSTFVEVDPPHRFSHEWSAVPDPVPEPVFDPVFGPVMPPRRLNTMEFAARDGGCLVTARVECVSVQARDGQVRGGFAQAVQLGMVRLDSYLAQHAA